MPEVDGMDQAVLDETSQPFVGQWNHLVSMTNWEKGRIIDQWRKALLDQDAPRSEYSDEAWAVRVSSVTSQHVGRLRRVYERFGGVHDQYEGLAWSHFQAALDWDDAEMWLEGGVQNKWSVSQLRKQRWEALGAPAELKPRDEDIIVSDHNEDVDPDEDAPVETISPSTEVVQSAATDDDGNPIPAGDAEYDDADLTPDLPAGAPEQPAVASVRPFENLATLPEDLTEAFEQFKMAILRHKMEQWEQISRDDVLATLDALKELALAPAAD
jgi:hypothetical protein